MELRLLTTEAERELFAHHLESARKTRGAGFVEARRSRVGEVHLKYGQLYALYDENGPMPGEMLGGFVMHDVGSFPQSFPKPDLSHLAPWSILEFGELWSRAKGAGLLSQRGAVIVTGLLQAQAMLVYPICKPWDLTGGYNGLFEKVCEPVEWPYVRTIDGGPIWVQPMTLAGVKLQQIIRQVWLAGFETSDEHRRIRFANPFNVSPQLRVTSYPEPARATEEVNGAAHP
jgi:hypothetical protein